MSMLGKLIAAQRIIFAALIFLIPSQLGYHFWLASSYIQGIRVDYFAPTLYLTDILILALLGLFFLENRLKKRPIFAGIPKQLTFILLGLALINILFATSKELALIKWVKIIELILLSVFIKNQKQIKVKEVLLKTLLISGILFSTIGIAQFIYQRSLGGTFYLLGERTFNVQTPGIALANYFGYFLLRAYSTFSHPNSFAAFLGFLLICTFYFKAKDKLEIILKWSAFIFGLVALLLTHSNWGFVSLLIVFLGIYLSRLRQLDFSLFINWIGVLLIVLSLILPAGSDYILENKYIFSESLSERMYLARRAGEIVKDSPIIGVGLNNFIVNLPKVGEPEFSWRLQPVHNIFLLTFVEVGIIGVLLLGFILFQSFKTKNLLALWLLVFILFSGLADHYWLTLQQNQIMLSLVLGLAARKY